MKRCLIILGSLLVASGTAHAGDAFDLVKCGSDIPRALMGQHIGNAPVMKIEALHTNLGLKNLGGDEISDALDFDSWQICGKEYVLLTDAGNNIRDILPFPSHSKMSPEYSGMDCQGAGKKMSGEIVAVLDNRREQSTSPHYTVQDRTLLPTAAAWRIDEKAEKFVRIAAAGLSCPRSGIITADGGP